jgi:enoyl-CoA hydratase/carnithine racemase
MAEAGERHVHVRVEDGVATLTLDRPAERNAFSGRMGRELGEAYRTCDASDDVRAVVLTGAGSTFCVGADLAAGSSTFERRGEPEFSAAGVDPPAFDVRKPVIAAVNGHAVGIGLTLAMQCDIRIVAREAKCGFLHVRRGVIPDAYSHWTVPRAIGFARAAELFLTGRTFTGEEAAAMGLASRALPAVEVLPAALEIARDIAVNVAPLSAALCKRLLWEGQALGREAVERKETALHHVVMGRADALEGVMAFLEKRTPRWQLRVGRDWPERWPD